MSTITQLGQRCGHQLRPGAQFCTVCGRQVADEGRHNAPIHEEQVPAAAPQPAVPSGSPGGSGPLACPPAQGCGHELRLGAQFCTVCGRPAADATRWPGPSPTPGEVMPPHRGTTPRQGRRHRSRWPLVAGAVALLAAGAAAAAVVIGQPSHHSHAAAGTSQTAAPAAGQPVSAPATPTPSSQSAPQQAAENLARLLAQSVTDRSSVVNAASSVSQCDPALSQDPQVFENAAAARQRLLSQLASLPGRSALSGQMLGTLTGAWRASAAADQDLARWAGDELSQGCTPNDQADPNFQAAAGPDSRATTGKKAFVRLWNPMAAQYGLPSYRWNQL